jgi:hypothetical protein
MHGLGYFSGSPSQLNSNRLLRESLIIEDVDSEMEKTSEKLNRNENSGSKAYSDNQTEMIKNSHTYSKDDFMSRDAQSIGVMRVEQDNDDLRN